MSETYDRVEVLQASPLFNDLLPLEKQYLADLAVHRSLGAGDVLFEARLKQDVTSSEAAVNR